MKVVLTQFAVDRHFDPKRAGTTISIPQDKFEAVVNGLIASGGGIVRNGYAPFCKLLFVENWMNDVHLGTLEITPKNKHLLHSGFKARTDDELPVLGRWFESNPHCRSCLSPAPAPSWDSVGVADLPEAKYLCIVLYDTNQMKKEGINIGDADYGIVAILGQTHNEEEPMPPVTMMRNALGVDEGGSGVPLDREDYARSVEFWSNHAVVK